MKMKRSNQPQVFFTLEELEILFKMNRPDFNELITALKGGSSKGVGFQLAKPWNFDGVQDRKVVDVWLVQMNDYLYVAKVGRYSSVELA